MKIFLCCNPASKNKSINAKIFNDKESKYKEPNIKKRVDEIRNIINLIELFLTKMKVK